MTPIDVIKAFYQKGENDCTTLGTIKAAVARFGINNVFKTEYDSNDKSYLISFKNGDAISVLASQISSLNQYSGFEPNLDAQDQQSKSIFEYSLFCFGVFVIYYAKENDNMTVQEALFHIDSKGINSDNSYHYLGFSDSDITWLTSGAGTKDVSAFTGTEVYILSNFYHTVMACFDQYDEFSKPTSTLDFAHNHGSIFHGKTLWAYKFN